MKKIAICGLACAGKTTAYKAIASGTTLKFAQPHYDVLNILGVTKNRQFMQEFSDLAKKHFGQDVFVNIFEKKAKLYSQIKSILTCDDLRFQIEFDSCMKNNWVLVYIESDEKYRKARSDKSNLSWEPHHNSEKANLFKHRCHFIVENNGTIKQLENKIRNLDFDSMYT